MSNEPVVWPTTSEQLEDFIKTGYCRKEGHGDDAIYTLSVHDLLSAFADWPYFSHLPAVVVPPVIVDALKAAHEEREGWRQLIAEAVRVLPDVARHGHGEAL